MYEDIRDEIYEILAERNTSKILLTEAIKLLGAPRSSVIGAMECCDWGYIAKLLPENRFEKERLWIVKW